jgi:carbamate kinase
MSMSTENTALIALGGNALILPGERGRIEEQFGHTDVCMKQIATLVAAGWKIVITHGNGPIVGNILLRNECAKDHIAPMPLYICVADSQGGIGSMMPESLNNELKKIGLDKTVSAIITHVLVDRDDPAFADPSKPVGPYYAADRAGVFMKQGWKMRDIPGRGWRRLVPSPKPTMILEAEAIKAVFKMGIIPIAAGGGGVPVIEENNEVRGVDAVIDKDLSAALLARELGLDRFIILTDVDAVYRDWEKINRKRIESLSVQEARNYLREGQFPAGSMGPKIEAALTFIGSGGKEVIIAKPEDLASALQGKSGTRIIPSSY